MKPISLDKPLTEAELDSLEAFLEQSKAASPENMDLEELDGFFCALIAGPELVPPSEYLSEIFSDDTAVFDTEDEEPGYRLEVTGHREKPENLYHG